jgi:hypothetical protein
MLVRSRALVRETVVRAPSRATAEEVAPHTGPPWRTSEPRTVDGREVHGRPASSPPERLVIETGSTTDAGSCHCGSGAAASIAEERPARSRAPFRTRVVAGGADSERRVRGRRARPANAPALRLSAPATPGVGLADDEAVAREGRGWTRFQRQTVGAPMVALRPD